MGGTLEVVPHCRLVGGRGLPQPRCGQLLVKVDGRVKGLLFFTSFEG